ncbi:uncharacterized protein LOC107263228 isoform X2 [Cephus cinctus]|nr:uncharacterized protein LOC107263228 isoform X2 [Cephus cinctus]
MSIVLRTKIIGKYGNGKPYEKSFMTKWIPRHRPIASFVRNEEFFHNEAHVYQKLLPHLGPIAPQCIYADPERIIMEDLKSRGYVVNERRNLLDLEHCTAVVKTLASLHARSLALKISDPQRFKSLMSPLKEAVFPQDSRPAVGSSIAFSLNYAIKILESIEPKTDELTAGIELVKRYIENTYDVMRELLLARNDKYDVMSHGDAWNNNILFKHDAAGRVTDVKLLDFQIVRHTSAAIDFLYFVYSSAQAEVIHESFDDLVEIYHRQFIYELRRLHVPETNISDLTTDWFNSELQKYSVYGILTGYWIVNAVLADESDAIDMDSLTVEQMEGIGRIEPPIRPIIMERMKHITLHYQRRFS